MLVIDAVRSGVRNPWVLALWLGVDVVCVAAGWFTYDLFKLGCRILDDRDNTSDQRE